MSKLRKADRIRRILMASTIMAGVGAASEGLAQETDANAITVEEIIVTATRQAVALSRVPVSVTAYSQQGLDDQGVKSVDDLERLTPGVSLSRGGQASSSISMRGIASGVGAATTAIYIDDNPIQLRTLGFSAGNAYPAIFDLARVEVLRGPQGTLFGSSAQGGAIRFITPEPDLYSFGGYARSEISSTRSGDASYEAGLAVGGPIVEGVLGFRASLYHRRDGGWADKVVGTSTILSPNGALGPESLHFAPTGPVYENSNWGEVTAARLALTWAPTDQLKITPSILYQIRHENDAFSSFWVAASDYDSSRFVTPMWVSTVDADRAPLPNEPLFEPYDDEFILPSVGIELDLGWALLISNTSMFTREQQFKSDYTALYSRTYAGRPLPNPGDRAFTIFNNDQDNFIQEVRLQSANPDARLNWVAGVYYSQTEQVSRQRAYPNFIQGIDQIQAAVDDGAPFGPGYNAFINYYGMDLIEDGVSYRHHLTVEERHLAAFAQADYALTERLKLTVGVRAERAELEYNGDYFGPVNNQNSPRGQACVPNSNPCEPVPIGEYAPGEGPFAPVFAQGGASATENPVTPKFGLSFQADPDNMFYASIAQGYRIGGAQSVLPTLCNAQLIEYGYVDAAGNAASPTSYHSDSLWSYEIGAKNRILGGRVQMASSIYYIDWSDLQTSISLSSCSNSFVTNAGSATSKGFDLQADWQATDDLRLSAMVGYTDSTFDEATVLQGRVFYTAGSPIPNSGAPWTVNLSAQYYLPVLRDMNAFVRGDYTYNSEWGRTGNRDPEVANYDPMLAPRPETHNMNVRLGLTVHDVDVSLFVNNVFNEHPNLSLSRNPNQPVYTDWTFRPRTIGVTLSSRF